MIIFGLAWMGLISGCASTNPSPAPVVSTPSGGLPGQAAAPIPTTQYIEVGDTLSVTFFEEANYGKSEYLFQAGDTMEIVFSYQTPQIQNVAVRPDGKISLPVIGDVVAQGISATQLADRLAKIFGLDANKVTVTAQNTNSQVNTFLAVLTKYQNRSGVVASVRADGMISLPLLTSVHAEGKTVEQFRDSLQVSYGKLFPNLNVSVDITDSPSRRIAVLGQVAKPGVFPCPNPVNLMEALAYGGGLMDNANKKQILLFKRVGQGYNVYTIDLLDQVNNPQTYLSYYLGPGDAVFVPYSHIDNVDLYVQQYVVKLLPLSLGATATHFF